MRDKQTSETKGKKMNNAPASLSVFEGVYIGPGNSVSGRWSWVHPHQLASHRQLSSMICFNFSQPALTEFFLLDKTSSKIRKWWTVLFSSAYSDFGHHWSWSWLWLTRDSGLRLQKTICFHSLLILSIYFKHFTAPLGDDRGKVYCFWWRDSEGSFLILFLYHGRRILHGIKGNVPMFSMRRFLPCHQNKTKQKLSSYSQHCPFFPDGECDRQS